MTIKKPIKTEKWLRTWLRIKTEAYAKRTSHENMTVGALIGNLDQIYKEALRHLKEVNDGQVRKLRKERRETKEKVSRGTKVDIKKPTQQDHAEKS